MVCVGDKSLLVQSGDQHKFLVELHMVEGITLLLDHMASCKTPRVVVTCLNTYQDERLRDILMADTDTLESCLHLADPSEVSLIQNNERLISRVKEVIDKIFNEKMENSDTDLVDEEELINNKSEYERSFIRMFRDIFSVLWQPSGPMIGCTPKL